MKVALERFIRWNMCLTSGCMLSSRFRYIWESMRTSRSTASIEKLWALARCNTKMWLGTMHAGLRA